MPIHEVSAGSQRSLWLQLSLPHSTVLTGDMVPAECNGQLAFVVSLCRARTMLSFMSTAQQTRAVALDADLKESVQQRLATGKSGCKFSAASAACT